VPRVTRLRERGDRVDVELDGAPWRTVPLDVAATVGLGVGLELDRPRLRDLRRALRRSAAGARALRALRARDLASAELEARLERAGFAEPERRETVVRLERVGLVDDGRVAAARAAALAARGHGNASIRWDLECRGLPAGRIEEAVAALEPESERAARIVAERGRGGATGRLLARRGFDEDVVAAASGTDA
jgi:SOS response regulatory protein OraA/RecX